MEARPKEFRWWEGLALLVTCIAIQLMSEVLTQWGTFFYSPGANTGRTVYVAIDLAGYIFAIGLILACCLDPVIGLWSDRTSSRPGRWRILPIGGRRRPFIFWGSIGMVFTSVLFWYPPIHGESVLNFAYGVFMYGLHNAVFFTMCAVPFNSLAPEIARSQQARVEIGSWIAAGMIVGLAIAEIAPGYLVKCLDPARRGVETVAVQKESRADVPAAGKMRDASGDEEQRISAVGYQRTALLFAVVSLLFFQLTVWAVRERFRSDITPARTPPLRVMLQALGNTVFIKYLAIFFLFNIGFLGVQRVLPYWVQVGLHGEEDLVSQLMIPFIAAALIALVPTQWASKWIPVKWMLFLSLSLIAVGLPFMYFIAVSESTVAAKILMAKVLFAFCGLGQGMLYVVMTPLLGEIIDLDERSTGERREAVYGSISTLVWKASQALSVVVATQCMSFLGNSPDRPLGVLILGPVAGVFGVLGLVVCWSYPILHVTKESSRDGVA